MSQQERLTQEKQLARSSSGSPAFERFIPVRKYFNFERAQYILSEKQQESSDLSQILTKAFIGETNQPILQFGIKPEPQTMPNSSTIFSFRDAIPPQQQRDIPSQPFRILDAPDLQDDFYLNILDWSKDNILAVALYDKVYL